MKGQFETLHHFSRLVQSTQVSLRSDGVLTLEQGLERAVEMLDYLKVSKKKAMLIGNGGSAAIASHQAVDLWRNAGLKAMAFNDSSMLTCIANDFGYANVFSQPIDMFCEPGDCLIAVSSSGKSANILQAVDKARSKGAHIVTFSGFSRENDLRLRGDLNFFLPSQSYGIVEVGHLLLLHAVIDEFVHRTKSEKSETHDARAQKRSLQPDAAHT